jgi:hypothetical protein
MRDDPAFPCMDGFIGGTCQVLQITFSF